LLQKDLFGNKQGYSDFFIALARQSVQGVQLTKVDITDAGKAIEIYGRSASADRVPRYLQRLAHEKVMDGLEFGVFHIAQPTAPNAEGQPAAASSPPARGEVEFILRTQAQAPVAKP
jgi:Tfp pilus assembly protein PilN